MNRAKTIDRHRVAPKASKSAIGAHGKRSYAPTPSRMDAPALTIGDLSACGVVASCLAMQWKKDGANPMRPPIHACVPIRPEVVAKVAAWIIDHCEPMAGIRRRPGRGRSILTPVNSYGWKHAAESQKGGIGEYVTNGEFIAAAIRCGYRTELCMPGSLNVYFNMRARRVSP